jgi:hypothetical protein
MLLNNNNDTNNILNYLYNDNRDLDSPFNKIINMIGFDEEQIYNIIFTNTDLKYIEKQINNLLNCVNESNAELAFVLDIQYLIDLIKLYDNKKKEIHIYDFLLHILKNKVDNIFIFDSNNILNSNNKNSILNNELKYTLLKHNNTFNFDDNYLIQIYKNPDSLYWKHFNESKNKIEFYQEFEQDNLNWVNIDDDECILTTKNINELYKYNIFSENNKFVLHPLSKLNL